MAAEWQGKSRGTVFGYRIFVFCIKRLGLNAAYFVLLFVAFYFCFFARNSTKSIYHYFRKRLGYSTFKSIISIYKSYFVFGQTIIDKIAIAAGLKNKFSYTIDGEELIRDVLRGQKGGVLISAHVGNFEIAQQFFGELEEKPVISLLTADSEHTAIRDYLERVTKKANINAIYIKEDLSHIFEINSALSRNEIVCITGDRYMGGSKYLEQKLLGETAKFPAGPFHLASRLKVPVLFVYVMRQKNKHYYLYATTTEATYRDAQGLLATYAKNLEFILDKFPYQWFNYYDFWESFKK